MRNKNVTFKNWSQIITWAVGKKNLLVNNLSIQHIHPRTIVGENLARRLCVRSFVYTRNPPYISLVLFCIHRCIMIVFITQREILCRRICQLSKWNDLNVCRTYDISRRLNRNQISVHRCTKLYEIAWHNKVCKRWRAYTFY